MREGKNINLRPVKQEDVKTLYSWINDPDIVKFSNNYRPISEHEQLNWYQSLWKDPSCSFFCIELKKEKTIIGTTNLQNIDLINRRAMLSIKIAIPSQRGRGYGKEALLCLLDHGFNDLNLNRIWLEVFSENIAAIKAYTKLGFEKEGQLRQHYYVKGEYKDALILGIMKKNFTT